jgi:hypothetical protein
MEYSMTFVKKFEPVNRSSVRLCGVFKATWLIHCQKVSKDFKANFFSEPKQPILMSCMQITNTRGRRNPG